MKYCVSKLGEHGDFHLEETDIQEVKPIKDGDHAADLRVRFRRQYQESDVFEWTGPGSKSLRLLLVPRQVQEIVSQHREAHTSFCNGGGSGCYDYGKANRPPAGCTRCLLIEASYRSGQGDLRKAQTTRRAPPRYAIFISVAVLMGLVGWLYLQWTETDQRLDTALRELQTCQRQDAKHNVKRP